MHDNTDVTSAAVLQTFAIGSQWATADPFLFVAHHLDDYPEGNGHYGPARSLQGRSIGSDFSGTDGWNMYHGESVPGFPQHPHRGFETITFVKRGVLDHSDSVGARARYGDGDVQWMTAGKGVVHAEMFPLLATDEPNPLELFQIWLNLPARSKMVDPYFTMMWSEDIPILKTEAGSVTVVAGTFEAHSGVTPPPDSWAADADAELGIWLFEFDDDNERTQHSFKVPAARSPETSRVLYVYGNAAVVVDGVEVPPGTAAELDSSVGVALRSNGGAAMLLQGRSIGEPVARYGPFVMNTQDEIQQAFIDYNTSGFGGWPWDDDAPVHGPDRERFAVMPDGSHQRPGS